MNNGARQWATLSPVRKHLHKKRKAKERGEQEERENEKIIIRNMHEIKLHCAKREAAATLKRQQSTAIIFNLLQNFHKNDKNRERERKRQKGKCRYERVKETGIQEARERERGHLKQIMFACRLRGIFMSFSFSLSRINDTR